MTLLMHLKWRERRGELRGTCEPRQAGRIVGVERLIVPERPGAAIVRLLGGEGKI